MRIIAGRWKGRRLATVTAGIRPTSDRLREALFSALGDRIPGSVWLDAFAGSGAVGLEALSRGAEHVIFNDSRASARRLVAKNIELCGAGPGEATLLGREVFSVLAHKPDRTVDVFFFDPPYAFQQHVRLLHRTAASPMWSPQSLVIIEHFKKTSIDPDSSGLRVRRTLSAGDSRLLLLTGAAPDDSEERRQGPAEQ